MTKPFDMEVFLAGVLTGAHATRQRHIRQAHAIQAALSGRWSRDNPWRWQRKHIVWFLNCYLATHSASTCHYYRLTICLIAKRMGRTWQVSSGRKALACPISRHNLSFAASREGTLSTKKHAEQT